MSNFFKKNTDINIKDSESVENLIVLKNSRTKRTLVMVCVGSIVGLILVVTALGLYFAPDKDAIIQSAFIAVASFASNIGAMVVVAFMEMSKPENNQEPKQKSNEANQAN
jgi:uncharacterized membrane protein YdbT with pleckstrin-like domain